MLILLITLLVMSCIKQQRQERIQPGDPLPEFSTDTLSEANVSMTDLIGKPGLIAFFSTTCPDGRAQMPEVESAYRNLKEEATFLAIAREQDTNTVARYSTEAGNTLPVAAPSKRDIYDLFDKGHSSGVPLLVFFDEKGTVTRTSDDKAILEGKQITEWILNTTENL